MAHFRKPLPTTDNYTPFGFVSRATPFLAGRNDRSFELSGAVRQQGYVPNDIHSCPVDVPFMPLCGVWIDARSRSLSVMGWRFIYSHETEPGKSNHLHWPGGASGITLGPGYDMKERSTAQIMADMRAIGLPDTSGRIVALAAGLHVAKGSMDKVGMEKFVHDHSKDIDLTDAQQMALLKHIGSSYEEKVRRSLKVPLTQYEFDSLVSYAYNPGGYWLRVTHLINAGKIADAMKWIRASDTSRNIVLRGLVRRRTDEVMLFMEGKYQPDSHQKPQRKPHR